MKQIWFGTAAHAEWVSCPSTGMQRTKSRYLKTLAYENSGGDVIASAPYRNEFALDFGVQDASVAGALEPWKRFYEGDYGMGPFYLYDPMWADYNLFPANWAAPGLIEQGWQNFGSSTISYTGTDQSITPTLPPRRATWDLSGGSSIPVGKTLTILIPPGYTLSLGAMGKSVGTCGIYVVPAISAAGFLTLTPEASPLAFTKTVVGSTDSYVTIYMTGDSGTNTLTLASMYAQIRLTGVTATLPRHLPGEGTTGLKFSSPAIVENYVMASSHLVGMSTSLMETEAWS